MATDEMESDKMEGMLGPLHKFRTSLIYLYGSTVLQEATVPSAAPAA